MSFDAHKNLAYSLVVSAPSPALSGTSITVTSSEGIIFPATPFNATIWPIGVIPTIANAEIVRVTNITGDVLTITRAQEGTSARSIQIGDQIAATITKKTIEDIENAIVVADDVITATTLDANSVLYAVTDNTPQALYLPASTIVGRKATGNVIALTGAEALAILAAAPLASPIFTGSPVSPYLGVKLPGDAYARSYLDQYGRLIFGGTGSAAAQLSLDKDAFTPNFFRLSRLDGGPTIVVLHSDTNGRTTDAESTFTTRVMTDRGAIFLDRFLDYYLSTGDVIAGELLQKIGTEPYTNFLWGFYDAADSDPANQIKRAERFYIIAPNLHAGTTTTRRRGAIKYWPANATDLPTAIVHIGAGIGGATAGSAPFKVDSGPLLTTPEGGAIENDGRDLFHTDIDGARSELQKLIAKPYNHRGVALSGMEFSPTVLPGVGNTNFAIPVENDFKYFSQKGLSLIRLPILWERIQPTLNGALDTTYKGYIDLAISYARKYNQRIVLDLHNYGHRGISGVSHVIGDGTLTVAHLADLWSKLATAYAGEPTVWGYGVMNEPHNMPIPTTPDSFKVITDTSPTNTGYLRTLGNGVITIPDNDFDGLSHGTIELFIKTSYTDQYQKIFYKDSVIDIGIQRLTDGNHLFAEVTGVGNLSNFGSPISDGAWHHVAISWDGSFLRAYIDGVYISKVAQSGNEANDPNDLYIGKRITSEPFIGEMDEIRFSSIARYTTESSFSVPTTEFTNDGNTKILLHLNELSGSSVDDATGNNDGTLAGTALWSSQVATVTEMNQAIIDAIRLIDTHTWIIIPSDNWSGLQEFTDMFGSNPAPWWTDPNNRTMLEFHYYQDGDHSGSYSGAWSSGLRTRIPTDILPAFQWALKNSVNIFMGEYGVPYGTGSDALNWQQDLETFLQYMDAYRIYGTYWAAGSWYSSPTTVQPDSDYVIGREQLKIIKKHLIFSEG